MARLTTSLQVEEMRRRHANGESAYAIAHSMGFAYSTVARWVGVRVGIPGPRPRPAERCDMCGIPADEAKIIRFGLQRSLGTSKGNRGAGAIELCERCWKDTAAKRQRTKRSVAA